MLKGFDMSRRNLLYLVFFVSLVGGLQAGMWLSVQASSASEAQDLDDSYQESTSGASALLSPSQATTVTVHLPMLANNSIFTSPIFGVQMEHAIDDSQGLAHAMEAGMHWVRFSAFHWDQIEPVRTEPPLAPTYLWQNVDEQSLLNAAAKSMEVIAIVQFTPDWAQKVSGKYCGPIREDRLDEFAQFLQALVSRYSAAPYNVRYWELGNEPDIDPSLVADDSGFGCWGDNTDPYYGGRYYAEMLKVAYPAIKAADPEAQVLIGGLLLDCDPRVPVICTGIHGDKPPKFLEGILRNGGGPYFDIVSFHAYAYFNWNVGLGYMGNAKWPGSVTTVPEKTGFLREVLTAYGYGEKELMNTESALLCGVAAEECLETQTMYVPRAYAEALALELRAQTYYALINEDWRHTGLLLPDLTPKPVYHAYRTASSFLTSVRHVGAVKGYPVGIEGYTFRRVGNLGYLEVIWSADGSAQSVSLPAGASVYDRYGTLIASSGAISVDYSPVYVARP